MERDVWKTITTDSSALECRLVLRLNFVLMRLVWHPATHRPPLILARLQSLEQFKEYPTDFRHVAFQYSRRGIFPETLL